MSGHVDPLAAEVRAVEQGAHAVLQDDGSFTVRSSTRDRSWRVTYGAVAAGPEFIIKLSCDCESGMARPNELVSCWHAALVGRRLERMGWARWSTGYWWATEIALAAAGIISEPRPRTDRVRGHCPVCDVPVVFDYMENEKRSPRTVAAAHDPRCHVEYARRKVQAAGKIQAMERSGKPVDLWDRPEKPWGRE